VETRFSAVEDIRTELFEDVAVPDAVNEPLDRAVTYANEDDEKRAREYLREAFGGECDTDRPKHHEVDEGGRVSLCHRHKSEHESPPVFFEHRGRTKTNAER
jgi:peptide/nickel transport system ATP-binding protein